MRDKHEHAEVEQLGVNFEEPRDSLVQDDFPGLCSILLLRSVVPDPVSPKVTRLSHLEANVFDVVILSHQVRVLGKFEIEHVKVSFNVNALVRWVPLFIDKHEIGVDLEAAILTQDNTDLVVSLRDFVIFCGRSVLE